ncbi:hypothetical protein [Pseudomonas soli]|uniref:hypothetical protein n=1 Tax=Pseudomonas soli TaxID=1306993 RepID=UPI00345DE874
MAQENFHASVQYNDSVGTAASDDHDINSIGGYLRKERLIQDDDYVVGVKLWSGEVHGEYQNEPVYVSVYVARSGEYDNLQEAVDSGVPLKVHEIKLEMPLNKFFGFFKRFEIAISRYGLIDRRDVDIQ